MAAPHSNKYLFFSVLALNVILGTYARMASFSGFQGNTISIDTPKQGSASTSFDLPVNFFPQKNTKTDRAPSIGIPANVTCDNNASLCQKIKFTGTFSEADKRKYQSLLIKQIKNIDAILDTSTNLEDALYSITLDSGKGTRRGLAGKSTVIISIATITSQQEFLEIATHELGHIVDLGVLQGNSSSKQKAFVNIDQTLFPINDPSLEFYNISRLSNTIRKSTASSDGFVGGYAMNDPFEDFAETFNMYLNHHNVFALLASDNTLLAKKYTYMERLFTKKYLQADIATATSMKDSLDYRPWDTTKGY